MIVGVVYTLMDATIVEVTRIVVWVGKVSQLLTTTKRNYGP